MIEINQIYSKVAKKYNEIAQKWNSYTYAGKIKERKELETLLNEVPKNIDTKKTTRELLEKYYPKEAEIINSNFERWKEYTQTVTQNTYQEPTPVHRGFSR